MTTGKKRIVVVVTILLAGLVGVGGYIYYMQRRVGLEIGRGVAEQLSGPHTLRNVDTQAWQRLHVGMTHERVIEILGDPPLKVKPEPSSKGTREDWGRSEFWEWGYAYGLFVPVAHERAFVVYFDPDGKVSSFRAPQVVEE